MVHSFVSTMTLDLLSRGVNYPRNDPGCTPMEAP
jgi:hypothetical protein